MVSKLRRVFFATLISVFGSIPVAQAVLIDTTIGTYEASAELVGTYPDLVMTLGDQAWWNDIILAREFAGSIVRATILCPLNTGSIDLVG